LEHLEDLEIMTKTLTRTISGSAPEELADRVQEVARIEDRTPSQVVVSAVDLYTRLPTEAHIALRRIQALGGETALERVLVDLGRQILDRQFEAARHAVAASITVNDLDRLESDDEFLAAAAAAVRRTGTREGRGEDGVR
jgi:hypothetical protein